MKFAKWYPVFKKMIRICFRMILREVVYVLFFKLWRLDNKCPYEEKWSDNKLMCSYDSCYVICFIYIIICAYVI